MCTPSCTPSPSREHTARICRVGRRRLGEARLRRRHEAFPADAAGRRVEARRGVAGRRRGVAAVARPSARDSGERLVGLRHRQQPLALQDGPLSRDNRARLEESPVWSADRRLVLARRRPPRAPALAAAVARPSASSSARRAPPPRAAWSEGGGGGEKRAGRTHDWVVAGRGAEAQSALSDAFERPDASTHATY